MNFRQIKDFLTFNKSERNGIVILCILLTLLIIIPNILPYFQTNKVSDYTEFNEEIEQFLANRELLQQNKVPSKQSFDFLNTDKSVAEINLQPFYFNPNNLPEEKWKALGLKENQIRMIKNYEQKGGKFYKKEDVKKLYCITEEEYNILEPFIIIPETIDSIKFSKYSKRETKEDNNKKIDIIELNAADTSVLVSIKGIGKTFARRIVSYRKKLGGYYKKEQLLEVWGIDTSTYMQISKYIEVNPLRITRISINSATIDQLKEHPYIDFFMAQALVNYRNKHGKYKKVEDIKNVALINDEIFQKLQYYLDVE